MNHKQIMVFGAGVIIGIVLAKKTSIASKLPI